MTEPAALAEAREHLSRAEAGYRSADGLAHLVEGLALLDKVVLDGAAEHRTVAANLLTAYSTKICESVRQAVASDRALPEPELEHLFKVLLAFDATELELPDYAASLKIDVVRRLVDLYYEGHPAEARAAVLEQLAGIAGEGRDRSGR